MSSTSQRPLIFFTAEQAIADTLMMAYETRLRIAATKAVIKSSEKSVDSSLDQLLKCLCTRDSRREEAARLAVQHAAQPPRAQACRSRHGRKTAAVA